MGILYLILSNLLVMITGAVIHGRQFRKGRVIPRDVKGPLAWAEAFFLTTLCLLPVLFALIDPNLCFGAIFLFPGVRSFGDYIKNVYLERELDYIGFNSRWDDFLQFWRDIGVGSFWVRLVHLGFWAFVAWLASRYVYETILSLIWL